MKTFFAVNTDRLLLGKQGENLALRVGFPIVNTWRDIYGDGVVQLVNQRSEDSAAYPVVLVEDDGMYYWEISATDTAQAGRGACELLYTVGDTLVKSITYYTHVLNSISNELVEVPDPPESYLQQVANEGAKAVAAAEKATAAAVHPPKLSEQYTWMVWDFELGQYVDTGVSVGGSGDGTPGGYYTPVVTQPDAGTMQVAYVPSAGGLPEVPPVNVTLPQGPKGDNGDSGEPPAGGGEACFPKFELLHTHVVSEEESTNVVGWSFSKNEIPNLNDYNVFVITLRSPDGSTFKITTWLKLRINGVNCGDISGLGQYCKSYAISAHRLFGVWVSNGIYNAKTEYADLLPVIHRHNVFTTALDASAEVTIIGLYSYMTNFGVIPGAIIDIYGAK